MSADVLAAGLLGWAALLAAAGTVLLGFCVVFSLVSASVETWTLGMGAAAYLFAGVCWLPGRLARRQDAS